jgi:hypothetical protein
MLTDLWLRFMSGNLCHQIEHHLFPDLPSNRLHEISNRVKGICDKYDLPYTTCSFLMQYGKTWRTIAKLSLPDRYLGDTADDEPETRSEAMFTELQPGVAGTDPGCRVSKFVANSGPLTRASVFVSPVWRMSPSHFRGESWNHTGVQCLGGRVATCWPSGRVLGVRPSAGGLRRDRRPGAAW